MLKNLTFKIRFNYCFQLLNLSDIQYVGNYLINLINFGYYLNCNKIVILNFLMYHQSCQVNHEYIIFHDQKFFLLFFVAYLFVIYCFMETF
jgi:hypothetical protein